MRFLATQECTSDVVITIINIRCVRISVTCHCESVSYSQFEIVTLLVSHGALGDGSYEQERSTRLILLFLVAVLGVLGCCSWCADYCIFGYTHTHGLLSVDT